jgi:DNA-directed RNA polymerase subunit omega
MARITIEARPATVDKYEFGVLAGVRAKKIGAGEAITVDRDNDKNTVIALREIEIGNIDVETLRETLIESLRKGNRMDLDPEENLHAETQEQIGEAVNYSTSEDKENLFLEEMEFNADAEGVLDFSDDVSEEDL